MIQNSTNVFNVWEKQARENVAMARTDLEEPHLESQVNSFCEANFEKSKKNKKKQFVGSSSLFFLKKKFVLLEIFVTFWPAILCYLSLSLQLSGPSHSIFQTGLQVALKWYYFSFF